MRQPGSHIPPFVSIGNGAFGPGFLGASYAPFVVDSNGDVRNLRMDMQPERLAQRLGMLSQIEGGFAASSRGMPRSSTRR